MRMGAQTAAGEAEDVILRIQFHDHGDKTRITLHQGPFDEQFRDMTGRTAGTSRSSSSTGLLA